MFPPSPTAEGRAHRTGTTPVDCRVERHLNHVCREWRLYYNRERPHEARWHLPPGTDKVPTECRTAKSRKIVFTSRLGGA
jgi:hypothetical protein